MKSRESP